MYMYIFKQIMGRWMPDNLQRFMTTFFLLFRHLPAFFNENWVVGCPLGWMPGAVSPSASSSARHWDSLNIRVRIGVMEDRLMQGVMWNDLLVLRGIPPIVKSTYNLCPRPHDFILPTKDNRNFFPHV